MAKDGCRYPAVGSPREEEYSQAPDFSILVLSGAWRKKLSVPRGFNEGPRPYE
jgi:hypothetical protein